LCNDVFMYHSVLVKISIQKQFLVTIAEIATQLLHRTHNLKKNNFIFKLLSHLIIYINAKKHEERCRFNQNIRLEFG